mmetsp:Transcript_28951/g.48858  ORF Transcript_28951/g.48858 Transcript_28951/m.48858 type:complete len:263 (-) Transcript_28951:12-800(-)
MRSDPNIKVEKVPYRILDKARLLSIVSDSLDALFSVLTHKFLTLYELWEWFVAHTGFDCNIELLRQVILDNIESAQRSIAHIDERRRSQSRGHFSALEVMVFSPPPPSHEGSSDGLKMAIVNRAGEEIVDPNDALCDCHNALLPYLERQNDTQMSGTCASVDENSESDMNSFLSLSSFSSCAQPTCLLIHCLGFKIRGQKWPDPQPLLNITPSQRNPLYEAREKALKDRLEAVQEAQSRSQVQVSDVTLELIDELHEEWDDD